MGRLKFLYNCWLIQLNRETSMFKTEGHARASMSEVTPGPQLKGQVAGYRVE